MKNMKSLILAAALGLASMTVASAKTFNMVLSETAVAGSTQLAAGTYTVNVTPRYAMFTNTDTSKSVMVLYRLDSTNANYEHTAIDLKNEGGAKHIESIELESTGTKLEF